MKEKRDVFIVITLLFVSLVISALILFNTFIHYRRSTKPDTIQVKPESLKFNYSFKYNNMADTMIILDTLPIVIESDTSYYIYSKQNFYIYRRSFKNIYIYLKNGDTILIDTLNKIHIKGGNNDK